MESKAKLFGHPIHPMLIPFPVGLLSTAVAFDILFLLTGSQEFARVAFWLTVGGLVGGAAAAPFGLIDWLALPSRSRAKRVGGLHGAGNALVLVLFGVSLLMRLGAPEQPSGVAVVVSLLGVALVTLTGWLGGELVDRLGVGVDDGANIDAPSSLSGRPAGERSATS